MQVGTPYPKEELPLLGPEAWSVTQVLTNDEVSYLLDQYEASSKETSGAAWQMPPMAQKSREYLNKLNPTKSMEAVSKIRELFHPFLQSECHAPAAEFEAGKLQEWEFALIANLAPETVEEAETLINSLQKAVVSSMAIIILESACWQAVWTACSEYNV
eukprot:jgi/Chrzof1/1082/Cz01g39150.t1